MSYQPLGDEGAQMEREVEVKQDVLQEKIKYLVQLGLSQGLSSVDFRDLLDMLEIRFIIKHGKSSMATISLVHQRVSMHLKVAGLTFAGT